MVASFGFSTSGASSSSSTSSPSSSSSSLGVPFPQSSSSTPFASTSSPSFSLFSASSFAPQSSSSSQLSLGTPSPFSSSSPAPASTGFSLGGSSSSSSTAPAFSGLSFGTSSSTSSSYSTPFTGFSCTTSFVATGGFGLTSSGFSSSAASSSGAGLFSGSASFPLSSSASAAKPFSTGGFSSSAAPSTSAASLFSTGSAPSPFGFGASSSSITLPATPTTTAAAATSASSFSSLFGVSPAFSSSSSFAAVTKPSTTPAFGIFPSSSASSSASAAAPSFPASSAASAPSFPPNQLGGEHTNAQNDPGSSPGVLDDDPTPRTPFGSQGNSTNIDIGSICPLPAPTTASHLDGDLQEVLKDTGAQDFNSDIVFPVTSIEGIAVDPVVITGEAQGGSLPTSTPIDNSIPSGLEEERPLAVDLKQGSISASKGDASVGSSNFPSLNIDWPDVPQPIIPLAPPEIALLLVENLQILLHLNPLLSIKAMRNSLEGYTRSYHGLGLPKETWMPALSALWSQFACLHAILEWRKKTLVIIQQEERISELKAALAEKEHQLESLLAHGQEKLANAEVLELEAERLKFEAQALMMKAHDLSSASQKDKMEGLQAQAAANTLSKDLVALQSDLASRMARVAELRKSEPRLD